jgi:transposase
MKNFLTDEQRKNLKLSHRKERDRRIADRIKAVILKDKGWTYIEIAEALMLDEETISSHINEYVDSQKLKPENGGSECKLNSDQCAELEKYLEEITYTKVQDICAYVKKQYNVTYTVSGLTALLYRLGFVYKQPKTAPAKADPEKQQAFIDEYKKFKDSVPENEPILFVDAVHPTMATKVSYGWIKKGQDKLVASTASRTRVNLIGSIKLDDLSTITGEFDTVDGKATVTFFEKVLNTFPDAPKIHIFLDQSGYHRSQEVKKFAQENRIVLHFLPPYSPNLNPIGRLWKVMNEYVRNNRSFTLAQQFKKDIKSFFENTLPNIAPQLRSRINDNFNIIKLNNLLKSASSS